MRHTLKRRKYPHTQGYTLIELLIILGIIAVLAAMLSTNVINARKRVYHQNGQTYARQMGTWVNSWLTESPQNRVANLDSSCTATAYVQQGASGDIPTWVDDCKVQTTPDGEFFVSVKIKDGTVFIHR